MDTAKQTWHTIPINKVLLNYVDEMDDACRLELFDVLIGRMKGVIPDKQSLKKDTRWAYMAIEEHIDNYIKVTKAGEAGTGEKKARYGNQNARKRNTVATETQQERNTVATETQQERNTVATETQQERNTVATETQQKRNLSIVYSSQVNSSVCATHAHTREEVFSIGKDPAKFNPPIPDGWLDYFFERMTQSGWADKDGKPIRNLAATISAWWARDKATYVEPTKPQPPKPTAPADWTLCLERCANCDGNECTRGIKVPPDKNPMRPMQPEECPLFTAIAKEGAA